MVEVNHNARIGVDGEREAVKWLRKRGYLIHSLNWRTGHYEIDIVAEKLGVIHFVEVKSRKAGGLNTPEDAMTADKIRSMIVAVRAYIAQYNIVDDYQFDLIAVDIYPDGEHNVRMIERAIEIRW